MEDESVNLEKKTKLTKEGKKISMYLSKLRATDLMQALLPIRNRKLSLLVLFCSCDFETVQRAERQRLGFNRNYI